MKFYSASVDRSGLKGFTIIELLVAVGVTALLVSLMLTIVVNVLNGWNRSSGSLTSGNQARAILDLLTSDLQSAIMRRDGNVWMAATIQTSASGGEWAGSSKPSTPSSSSVADSSLYLPPVSPVSSIEEYRFGQGGVWLRLISTVPSTNTAGDLTTISAPRAISYQILRQSVASGSSEKRYLFFRSELAPTITFTTGYNLFDENNYYESGAGSILKTPTADTLVANNVVDFGVRFYERDSSSQLVLVFPDTSSRSFAATSDTTKVGPGNDAAPVRRFPAVAEVFVRILTDEGAQQIANLEANLPVTGTWWEIVLANSRVYSRRIDIKADSL